MIPGVLISMVNPNLSIDMYCIYYKVCYEITYPFINVNGTTFED